MMRLVLDANGQAWPDLLQKAPGRGAYLCMQPACLRRLNDKGLQRAWRSSRVSPGTARALRERIRTQLSGAAQKLLGLQKARVAIGREAVLQRLHKGTCVHVMLAADAGNALVRQVRELVRAHGHAELITFPSSGALGAALGRGPVAVVAMEATAMAEKVRKYCNWYVQFTESR